MEKQFVLLLCILLPLISISQNFEIKEKDGKFTLADIQAKTEKSLPKAINRDLSNSAHYQCSEDGTYIAYVLNFSIMLYSVDSKSTSELMSLYSGSKAVSALEWYSNKKIAFVNINPSRYKNSCMLFVLDIENGQLKRKRKFDLAIDYKITNNKSQPLVANAEFGFNDRHSIYYTPKEQEYYYDIELYSKKVIIDNSILENKYNFFLFAEALPSDYAYQLIDNKGNEISLPKEVKIGLISPTIFSISPDNKYLIFVYESQIKSYNLETGDIQYLMALHSDSEGTSNIIWSENGNRFAFININQSRYKEMCKIFVLEIAEGALKTKMKFDAPVFFHCGARCYPSESDFKFINETTLQYKRHEMIEERPGEVEEINL